MILPDINLLLYAYDASSPHHAEAAQWWEGCLSGSERVGLAQVVLFGFVRVATHPRVFQQPLTVREAVGHVRSWLVRPNAVVLEADEGLVEPTLKLLEEAGTAGNLVTNAQIAALALVHGATLHTADTDFLRFPGLRWFNPITGLGSRHLRKA